MADPITTPAGPVVAPPVKPKAEAELPVDFPTLFMCATHPRTEWPKAVLDWGAKAKANQHLLDHIHSLSRGSNATGNTPIVLSLIGEVLKAVKG